MIDIKLDYFTLLSPEPILINGVGSVKSPTLRDISKLNNGLRSYDVYQTYLSALLTNINAYYEIIEKYGDMYFSNYSEDEKQIILKIKKEYENLSDEDKTKISMFNILIFDKQLVKTVCEALNFFMLDKVIFSDEHMVFLTYNNLSDDKPTGYIDQNIYSDLINIILQRVNISNNNSEYENVKVKNKTTARLLEKMKKSNEKSKKKRTKKWNCQISYLLFLLIIIV